MREEVQGSATKRLCGKRSKELERAIAVLLVIRVGWQ